MTYRPGAHAVLSYLTQDKSSYVTNANHRDDEAGRLEQAREAAEVQITAAALVRRQVAEVGQTSATKSCFQLASV